MNRVFAVVRMYLTDWLTVFVIPLAILATSLLVNLVIFAVGPEKPRTSGGVAAIFVVLVVAAVMGTARGMPFALSMGASRRAFLLGTGATGGVLAVAFGILLLVLNRVESLTDGWWLHGHFFTFDWIDGYSPAADWLLATLLLLANFLLGAFAATIWLRWRQVGMLVGGIALTLVLGGGVIFLTWRHDWQQVGHWLTGLTPLTAAGWIALLCLPLAGGPYLTLRRVAV